MPQIPRAAVFVAQQSGGSQVLADPNMFNAEGQGLQQLGAGIQQAAAGANEYAQKMDYAAYVAKSAEADRKLKTAWTSYQEQLETNAAKPDEWVKNWQQMSGKIEQEIDLGNMSKPMQARVKEQIASFNMDSASQISLQARKQQIANGRSEITSSASLDLKNGDWVGYETKIREGARAGFFDPATENKLIEQGRVDFDVEAANKAINLDPIAATAALEDLTEGGKWRNFKAVDENTRLSLLREARTATSNLRAETMQSFMNRRNAGELVSDAELQAAVDRKLMTPQQKTWIISAQKRSGDDPRLTVEFAAALREVDAYNKQQDPENMKFAELTARRSYFTADQQKELERRLNARMKPADTSNGEPTVLKRIDALLDGGFFGNISKHPASLGKLSGQPVNKLEYVKAYEENVRLKGELVEFLKKKPDASPMEQNEFINIKLKDIAVKNAGLAMLLPFANTAQKKPASAYQVISITPPVAK